MPEELRVFVRAALYVALITAVYWFVSDEAAGTLLLVFLFVGAASFVVVARVLGRKTEAVRGGPLHRAASVVALDDAGGDVPPPLAIEEEPVVTTSPWPLGAALAGMLIGLGLLYGPWLWIPGAGLALSVAYGWITQTDV
ncbi:MAG: cytochrome c oxidase subunit 4 [Actinomycetota bacterium]|nr:cytochrome c oxidase subunit 4 [Actinomycetota bacterium]